MGRFDSRSRGGSGANTLRSVRSGPSRVTFGPGVLDGDVVPCDEVVLAPIVLVDALAPVEMAKSSSSSSSLSAFGSVSMPWVICWET